MVGTYFANWQVTDELGHSDFRIMEAIPVHKVVLLEDSLSHWRLSCMRLFNQSG